MNGSGSVGDWIEGRMIVADDRQGLCIKVCPAVTRYYSVVIDGESVHLVAAPPLDGMRA